MKRQFFIFLAIALPGIAAAQSNNFTITGHIGSLNGPGKVYLDYMDDGVNRTDSSSLVNGVFKFAGHTPGYSTARMAFDHDGGGKDKSIYSHNADAIYFYFGKENVQISSKDSLSNAVFAGSKVYDEFRAYVKETGGTVMQFAKEANYAIESQPDLRNDPEYVREVGVKYREKMDKHAELQVKFAKDHPDSYFGLVGLSEGIGNKFDPARVEPIYNALKKEYRDADMGKELRQRIDAIRNITVGAKAPVFTENDPSGKPVSLTDLRGKVVLIDFWASWCVPCRGENPNLVAQYKLYKDKGFEILSVSLDSDKLRWANAIAADGLKWTQVSDLKGWNNMAGRLYGVRAVPQTYLLDKDGNVIAVNLKGDELNAKLAELFKN